jgi:hypothetical protein
MGFAVANLDSVFQTHAIHEELPTSGSGSAIREEAGTINLFPPFVGIVGFGLVSFAAVSARAARKSN